MSKNIPVFNINVPYGGPQPAAFVTSDTPIFSSYTGNLIGYGPIGWGTPNDAPIGNHNYGKPFHVIEFNPSNNSYMAHGYMPTQRFFY
jgi:hypothetical protein